MFEYDYGTFDQGNRDNLLAECGGYENHGLQNPYCEAERVRRSFDSTASSFSDRGTGCLCGLDAVPFSRCYDLNTVLSVSQTLPIGRDAVLNKYNFVEFTFLTPGTPPAPGTPGAPGRPSAPGGPGASSSSDGRGLFETWALMLLFCVLSSTLLFW